MHLIVLRDQDGSYVADGGPLWNVEVGEVAWAVGSVGEPRFRQIVRHSFEWPEPVSVCSGHFHTSTNVFDPVAYAVRYLIPALTRCLEENGSPVRKDTKCSMQGQLLAGHPNGFITIDSDLEVITTDLPFAAIGSGSLKVRGALFAAHKLQHAMSAKDRFEIAKSAMRDA